MIAYVASLPAPLRLEPANADDAKHANRGEAIFESCGCCACHVPDVGKVTGIYSDLLLHEMGDGLSDPVPAISETGRESACRVQSSSSAYGGGRTTESLSREALALRREWKTPPLWGVRFGPLSARRPRQNADGGDYRARRSGGVVREEIPRPRPRRPFGPGAVPQIAGRPANDTSGWYDRAEVMCGG